MAQRWRQLFLDGCLVEVAKHLRDSGVRGNHRSRVKRDSLSNSIEERREHFDRRATICAAKRAHGEGGAGCDKGHGGRLLPCSGARTLPRVPAGLPHPLPGSGPSLHLVPVRNDRAIESGRKLAELVRLRGGERERYQRPHRREPLQRRDGGPGHVRILTTVQRGGNSKQ